MGVRNEFDINRLFRDYRDGGTESSPVIRSLTTISTKLINDYKFSPEVVGAAVYKVAEQMVKGLEFKGDGTYGSKGRELFSCIKAQCVQMVSDKTTELVVSQIKEMCACTLTNCPLRTKEFKDQTKWQRFKMWILRKVYGTS